jgi:hypothetical protein
MTILPKMFLVRRVGKTRFSTLITGRTFMRPSGRVPDDVWFKIDKVWASTIDDENTKRRMNPEEDIIEVAMIQTSKADLARMPNAHVDRLDSGVPENTQDGIQTTESPRHDHEQQS